MEETRYSKGRILTILIMLSTTLFLVKCKKSNVQDSPESDSPALTTMPNGLKLASLSASGITSSSYYLENALPSNYVRDGTKDYTAYVQAAINKYSNLVFPAFPILVSDLGLVIGSNKTLTFLEGSEIRLKPTSSGTYSIIKIGSATNIALYNPVIVGDRFSHTGTGGEAGIGINIRGSSNITIHNPKVRNCWGDGIYVGQADNRINCKNIIIKNAHLSKNRRDGITIIAVDGLLLDNIYAGYSDGTLPMSGINFEPNNTLCEIKNVRINNPRTENNGANGIQIGLSNLLGTIDKQSDITVVNHVDIGSPRYAFKMRCNNTNGATAKMVGQINVINPTWNKTVTEQPLYLSSNQSNYKTTVSSPQVMKTSGYILSYPETYTLLMQQARSSVITVTDIIDAIIAPISEPQPETIENTAPEIIFAVNAGGGAYSANGIDYSSDKNYSGGSIYKNSNSIANTDNDALYQSERYGNFMYSIPVIDGSYEITFKFAEIYQKTVGTRQFDVLAENTTVISNLDLFSVAGINKAYDVVRSVTVTDGILNLNFRTDINNAKLSAVHVVRK